jgi:hypothetical protein
MDISLWITRVLTGNILQLSALQGVARDDVRHVMTKVEYLPRFSETHDLE